MGDTPRITSDGAGGAIVAWADSRNEEPYLDIYAQRVNASGAVLWTNNGVAICESTGEQCSNTIIPDGAAGAIIAFNDYRTGTGDIYVQRVDASGVVKWTADGVPVCTAIGQQYYPTSACDGADGVIVTWEDYRSGSADIYAQRMDSSGVARWTADGVAICTATAAQRSPKITSDGAGGAIITWYDNRDDGQRRYDIYAQKVDASGAVQWATDGVALCTATWDQISPQITSDGAGGAIVAWQDYRDPVHSHYKIYAQRVDASGAVEWTADGVRLCMAEDHQIYPAIVSDGAGGAIVTWEDKRGVADDIYAQRVDASGAVQWASDGLAICLATDDQSKPAITSDDAGGAIVTWYDMRSGDYDIYAQRVNTSGVVQWTADGVAVCTATESQLSPEITSDGWSGAIIIWRDCRDGGGIYAQRVDANGLPVLTVADGPTVPIELRQNYPNPFNPVTTVTYSIPEECDVTLKIYDVSGTYVACLVDRRQGRGSYALEWNGKDQAGRSVPSGIYFCQLEGGNRTISGKMVLVR